MLSIRNKKTGRRYWSWDEALNETWGDFEERVWSGEKVEVCKEFGGIVRVRVEHFGQVEEKTFYSREEARQYLQWRGWR